MTPIRFLLAVLLCGAATAQADIYKCVDDAGRVTYSNDKPPATQKGCTMLSRDESRVTTVPAPKRAAATPTPTNFPRVDDSTQKTRDNDRRKILENELAAEEKAADAAKAALVEQESQRLGDERNFQKYLDRIQPFKDKVQLHERNVEAIRKELSNLR